MLDTTLLNPSQLNVLELYPLASKEVVQFAKNSYDPDKYPYKVARWKESVKQEIENEVKQLKELCDLDFGPCSPRMAELANGYFADVTLIDKTIFSGKPHMVSHTFEYGLWTRNIADSLHTDNCTRLYVSRLVSSPTFCVKGNPKQYTDPEIKEALEYATISGEYGESWRGTLRKREVLNSCTLGDVYILLGSFNQKVEPIENKGREGTYHCAAFRHKGVTSHSCLAAVALLNNG